MFDTLVAKQALVLLVLASSWWSHGKTNSSSELFTTNRWPDVLSALLETVDCAHDLSIMSRSLQNDSNCNTTWNCWLESGNWSTPKTVSPSNSVHHRKIKFFYLSKQQNFSTEHNRVCDHHKWFSTQSFIDCKLSLQILRINCLFSRDFSDVPISSILGNIHFATQAKRVRPPMVPAAKDCDGWTYTRQISYFYITKLIFRISPSLP